MGIGQISFLIANAILHGMLPKQRNWMCNRPVSRPRPGPQTMGFIRSLTSSLMHCSRNGMPSPAIQLECLTPVFRGWKPRGTPLPWNLETSGISWTVMKIARGLRHTGQRRCSQLTKVATSEGWGLNLHSVSRKAGMICVRTWALFWMIFLLTIRNWSRSPPSSCLASRGVISHRLANRSQPKKLLLNSLTLRTSLTCAPCRTVPLQFLHRMTLQSQPLATARLMHPALQLSQSLRPRLFWSHCRKPTKQHPLPLQVPLQADTSRRQLRALMMQRLAPSRHIGWRSTSPSTSTLWWQTRRGMKCPASCSKERHMNWKWWVRRMSKLWWRMSELTKDFLTMPPESIRFVGVMLLAQKSQWITACGLILKTSQKPSARKPWRSIAAARVGSNFCVRNCPTCPSAMAWTARSTQWRSEQSRATQMNLCKMLEDSTPVPQWFTVLRTYPLNERPPSQACPSVPWLRYPMLCSTAQWKAAGRALLRMASFLEAVTQSTVVVRMSTCLSTTLARMGTGLDFEPSIRLWWRLQWSRQFRPGSSSAVPKWTAF